MYIIKFKYIIRKFVFLQELPLIEVSLISTNVAFNSDLNLSAICSSPFLFSSSYEQNLATDLNVYYYFYNVFNTLLI